MAVIKTSTLIQTSEKDIDVGGAVTQDVQLLVITKVLPTAKHPEEKGNILIALDGWNASWCQTWDLLRVIHISMNHVQYTQFHLVEPNRSNKETYGSELGSPMIWWLP